MGDHVQGFTEVQKNNIHNPSLVQWHNYSILEGHWVGQAGFALIEAVLAVPNPPPSPPYALAEFLGGTVPWPSQAQRGGCQGDDSQGIFLSTLFKHGYNVSPLPVSGDFPWLPSLFKCHGEWFGNSVGQLPEDSGTHPISPNPITYIQFIKWPRTWSLQREGPSPHPGSIHSRGMGREVASEDWGMHTAIKCHYWSL